MSSTNRRYVSAAALLLGTGLVAAATPAEAQQLRFSDTKPGSVIAIGNTLGLSKAQGSPMTPAAGNGPGRFDSIGTFLTLDVASVDETPANPTNPWGAGTTNDWRANGSTATLTLPSNEAEILRAELVWGGSWSDATTSLSDLELDADVSLSFGTDTISVSPDPITSEKIETLCGSGATLCRYYSRSANVTQFVQSHGAGEYAVEGVPATQSEITNSLNAAGWTLIVAYRFDGEPIRNMSIFVGNDNKFVFENATVDYTVDGFCAPPQTPFAGAIAISTLEGDAQRVGDQLAIGESEFDPNFVLLSGPNNPENNFFCSQINGPDGQLDTSGTAGDKNHSTTDTNPAPSANMNNVAGARQGWDVTTVPLSSSEGHLTANQTSAVLRTQTLSDSYMPLLAGISIDVNAPNFIYDASTTVVDKDTVTVGDRFTVTVNAVNDGFAPAQNVLFTLGLPGGVSLVSFTTDGQSGDYVGGMVTQPMLQPTAGVPMGTIDTTSPDNKRTVEVELEVVAPQAADIVLKPIWKYEYEMCAGQPLDEQFKAPVVTVDYIDVMGQGGAGGAGGSGGAGGGAGGEGGSGGAGGAGGGAVFPQGGGIFSCSATDASERNDSMGWAVLGLGAALFVARRRRSNG
jgi:uncharacterized repeat protein (TIGR01451 family)/MYXO-CTERM domain-containing protein